MGQIRMIELTKEGRADLYEKWGFPFATESKTTYREGRIGRIEQGEDGDYHATLTTSIYTGKWKDKLKSKKTTSIRIPKENISDRMVSDRGPAFLGRMIQPGYKG
jgi:hypothetical protein